MKHLSQYPHNSDMYITDSAALMVLIVFLDIGTMWKWAVQPALSRMCSFFLQSQSYLFDDTVKLLLPGGKMVVT